jgi:PAS domain S-box-containing protein
MALGDFPIDFVADLALIVAALYLGALLGLRTRGTRLWFPILMLFSAACIYGGAAVGADLAGFGGDTALQEQFERLAQFGAGLALPAIVHLAVVYPRNLRQRLVRRGLPVLYGIGVTYGVLSTTRLVNETVADPGRGISAVYGPLYGPITAAVFAPLLAALVWSCYLAVKGRTSIERRGGAGIAFTIGLPLIAFALATTVGQGTLGPLNPITMYYAAGLIMVAAVTYTGAIEPPLQATFRGLVESMDEAVMVVDAKGRLSSMNRAAERLLGLEGREVGFEKFEGALSAGIASAADVEHLSTTIRGVLRGRIENHEGVIQDVGPSKLTCRWRAFPLGRREASGEVEAVLLMLRDETKRYALEKATEESREVLDLVIGMLGHDLKAPLTVLQGYIDLDKMRLDGPIDPAVSAKVKADLDKMGEAVVGMHMMMGNARALSRLAATGDSGPESVGVDLTKLTRQACDLLQPVVMSHQLRLERSIAEGVKVHVVPGFDSVPRNLVDNAIKYTPPGGTVTVTLSADPFKVRLQVEDTGPGIPPEKKDQLFRKFERLGAEKGQAEGHGLGLSIVSKLVELSGGTIRAEDREDGKSGALFVVDLPSPKK